jgi:hypothetical protein
MFLAHTNDIKNNQYLPITQLKNKKVLVNVDQEYSLVSNVCPHQNSLISKEKGKGSRVCPYHGWSFDLGGNPIGSGRASCKNTSALPIEEIHTWNNLIFTVPAEFKELDIDFSNLELVEKRTDRVQGTVTTIMDIFLDVDHISIVHRGVYEQIGLANITAVEWIYKENRSLQLVANNYVNEEFSATLLPQDADRKYGAAWLAIYPGTMIEWQPGAVFITVATKFDDNSSNVEVFKYRDTRYSDLNWELNSEVWELAWSQDKEQVSLIAEVAQNNLEESKQHYRKFLTLSLAA